MKQIKSFLLLSILVFLLCGCLSKASEAIWNPSSTDFTISSQAQSIKVIGVIIPRSDHLNARTSSSVGTYFTGYYVYRNEEGPYSNYTLQGIAAHPSSTTPNYEQRDSSGTSNTDSNPNYYSDSSCTPNKIYYYRVIVMYQNWDGTSYSSELQDKADSSWAAAICPSQLVYSP